MGAITIITFITILGSMHTTKASAPRYQQPVFDSIEELLGWIETVDATSFQSGQFERCVLNWRRRGEIFIPYFSEPSIVLVGVDVIPVYRGSMMVHFVHSTPVGQIIVRVANVDPLQETTYEARGIGAYFTALWGREFEISHVSEKTIAAMDSRTGELVERNVSYAFVDNLDAEPRYQFAFTMFIMDGFELGITYNNQEVAKHFGDLVWDRAPITDRSVPAVVTLPELDPNMRVVRFVIGDTTYTIDRIPHESDVAPFIERTYERTMVPLRVLSEALGAEVEWIPETSTVQVRFGGDEHQLIVGLPLPNEMGLPALYQDRVFVPLRYVVETFGATIRWDGRNSAVYIYQPINPSQSLESLHQVHFSRVNVKHPVFKADVHLGQSAYSPECFRQRKPLKFERAKQVWT